MSKEMKFGDFVKRNVGARHLSFRSFSEGGCLVRINNKINASSRNPKAPLLGGGLKYGDTPKYVGEFNQDHAFNCFYS